MRPFSKYLNRIKNENVDASVNLSGSTPPNLFTSTKRVALSARESKVGGSQKFKQKLSTLISMQTERICLAPGASQALLIALAAATSPGDEVVVEFPTYEPFIAAAKFLNLRVLRFNRTGDINIDLRSLSSASQGKKVVLLSNPNCPTGHLYSTHELERIAKHSKLLIVDEVFLPLFSSGRFSQLRSNSKIVGIGSLSKSLGLSHLRLGWLFGPSKFIAKANVLAFHFHTDMPNWSVVGGIQALKESKTVLAKLERMADQNREFVKRFDQSRPGLISHNFETGYFGTYKVPKSFRSAERFAETLLRDKKVWVRPCTEFGLKNEVRFHLLTSQREFRYAFKAMVTT